MIKSFRHKGLEKFFFFEDKSGIKPDHAKKLKRQLELLERAKRPEDMRIPGWNLHQLKGELEGFWSIRVDGNWRLVFRFSGNDADFIDYQDYH